MIVSRDVRKSLIHHKKHKLEYGYKSFLKTLRNIFVEFGPAEYLDTFIVRPFMMWFFPLFIGNFALGIVIGKILADIIFYMSRTFRTKVRSVLDHTRNSLAYYKLNEFLCVPTIIMYEIRKKYFDE